ncbi:MAG TPA: TonB-dependent receptor [Gemmatimonadales bacterium]|nr:TonB-dependent receptor [Gemmatimonadales bacterium]
MSYEPLPRRLPPWLRATLAASCLAFCAAPLAAQSLTVGALSATVVDEHGAPIRDVLVTLERRGAAFRTLTTDHAGNVELPVVTPGDYAILAEQLGYQPVRARNITVVPGAMTHVALHLTHRPPPITSVEDQVAVVTMRGATGGTSALGVLASDFDWRRDITDIARGLSQLQSSGDDRDGLAGAATGLPPTFSHLVVDGVEESLLRHPGQLEAPITTPVFSRDGMQQISVLDFGSDVEWPGTLGSIVNAQTASGNSGTHFHPWLQASSASLGGATADNPADSSTFSAAAGFTAGGAIKGDTGAWFVTANYQRLAQPTAVPFELGTAPGEPADLAGAIRTAALAHGSQNVNSWLAPTVRTWRGGSAMGRVDWQLGKTSNIAARIGVASWTEASPDLGGDATNGAGSLLDAHDFSSAIAYTTTGDNWVSETRFGVHSGTRNWTGASLAYTAFVDEGAAIGTSPTLPGDFSETGINASETFTYHSGAHTLKFGGTLLHRSVTDDWVPGSGGVYSFGDVAGFASQQGAFYQATHAGTVPGIGVTDIALFAEDGWHITPALLLTGGIRYQMEQVPDSTGKANIAWENASGLPSNLLPHLAKGLAGPRAGFAWDPSGDGRTTVRGNVGLVAGSYDVTALSEAEEYDGDVTVRRATGALAWPGLGGSSTAPVVGPAITMFAPDVRLPRAFTGELSFVRQVNGATTLTLSGAYHHSDYLLRRSDLNLIQDPVATTTEGRPVWGTLQQFGGLITPAVGSNRRFVDFDMVYGLASTGYDDDYEATAMLERRLTTGFTFFVSYTYSRTTDNLVGELSANPADHLSPFPGGLNGVSWDDGPSDLDIPHRFAATLQFHGKSPITLAAQYRLRSGLPFTPGFRAGVDANGDGSGNNDPAFIDASIPGMTQLAAANGCLSSQSGQLVARNSCRDGMVQALDLHASLALGRHLAVTVDGFNVVGTATGLMDRAAVLVDPNGSMSTNAAGQIVLPLIANTHFGQLLSRRDGSRTLRVGLQVGN